MVGVTAILAGWIAAQLWPGTFSGTYNSPLFMWLFCIVFSLGVGYIAYRGVYGTTAVNMAINIIQICALVTFAVMAIAYRSTHPTGSVGWHLSNGTPVNYNVAQVTVTDFVAHALSQTLQRAAARFISTSEQDGGMNATTAR